MDDDSDKEIDDAGNNGLMAIYCIQSDDGFIKVGVSGNLEKRLKALQTGNPHELRFAGISYIRCSDLSPTGMEIAIHEELREFSVRGEWFRATPDDFREAVNRARGSERAYKIDRSGVARRGRSSEEVNLAIPNAILPANQNVDRTVGRPPSIADMKTYKAMKQREYRKRWSETK